MESRRIRDRARLDDESARYTENGITVVALDRKGRGLHRARPERRLGSDEFPAQRPAPPRIVPMKLMVVLLGVAALVLALLLR